MHIQSILAASCVLLAQTSAAWPLDRVLGDVVSFGGHRNSEVPSDDVTAWSMEKSTENKHSKSNYPDNFLLSGGKDEVRTSDSSSICTTFDNAKTFLPLLESTESLADRYIVVFKRSVSTETAIHEHILGVLQMFETYLQGLNFFDKWINFAGQESLSFENYEKILGDKMLQKSLVKRFGKRSLADEKKTYTFELPSMKGRLPLPSVGGIQHVYRFGHADDKPGRKGHAKNSEGFQGYACKLPKAVIDIIKEHPDVDYIEKDISVKAFAGERFAPWGLARISSRKSILYEQFVDYCFDGEGGQGVNVYVIDTGIRVDHEEFGGRARFGVDLVGSEDGVTDGNGHGTHVAGTVGGLRYGVAKKARLIAVKVLNAKGAGTMSNILAGVDWVAAQHIFNGKHPSPNFRGSVINMSLGGPKFKALNDAIAAIINIGVHVAVAAGNENQDACVVSPASAEGVVTVAASNIADQRSGFSNWGKCVDIFAPGENIRSAAIIGERASAMLSGTSMASPHIAGLMAYELGIAQNPTKFTPKMMKQKLLNLGTKNVLSNLAPDTVNILAYNGYLEDQGMPREDDETNDGEEDMETEGRRRFIAI